MNNSQILLPDFTPYTVKKPWGYEYVYAKTDSYVGKLLHIKEGHRTSLQYHKDKKETLYVIGGTCEIQIGEEKGNLSVGLSVHIDPGKVHRISAISDCEILEISTPQLFDVVRLEDDYQRC